MSQFSISFFSHSFQLSKWEWKKNEFLCVFFWTQFLQFLTCLIHTRRKNFFFSLLFTAVEWCVLLSLNFLPIKKNLYQLLPQQIYTIFFSLLCWNENQKIFITFIAIFILIFLSFSHRFSTSFHLFSPFFSFNSSFSFLCCFLNTKSENEDITPVFHMFHNSN